MIDNHKNLDVKELFKILPHRYPFLFVDKILDVDLEKDTVLGLKNSTINEWYYQGHFPGAPIMPGVLILEALAQTGSILIYLKGEKQKIGALLNINNAKFRNPVRPGDTLYLKAQGLHFSSRGGKIFTVATVNDKIAAEAELGFALVDKNQI